MFVLLAKQASVGVILMRGGPSLWWHVSLWDTAQDSFESGQWFRGRIYPEKCDVSPNGKLFIYFAGKFRPRDVALGYHSTWIAVSRPPYLTALALWPVGDTWGGEGVFLDDRSVLITTSVPSFGAKHHPDHPPGPLTVVERSSLDVGDPRRHAVPGWRSEWEIPLPLTSTGRYPAYSNWRKSSGALVLERDATTAASRLGCQYTLRSEDGEQIALFKAHWADFDQQGRLVATVGGRVFAGEVTKSRKLQWRQLAAMHEEQPTQMEAPKWAQAW